MNEWWKKTVRQFQDCKRATFTDIKAIAKVTTNYISVMLQNSSQRKREREKDWATSTVIKSSSTIVTSQKQNDASDGRQEPWKWKRYILAIDSSVGCHSNCDISLAHTHTHHTNPHHTPVWIWMEFEFSYFSQRCIIWISTNNQLLSHRWLIINNQQPIQDNHSIQDQSVPL